MTKWRGVVEITLNQEKAGYWQAFNVMLMQGLCVKTAVDGPLVNDTYWKHNNTHLLARKPYYFPTPPSRKAATFILLRRGGDDLPLCVFRWAVVGQREPSTWQVNDVEIKTLKLYSKTFTSYEVSNEKILKPVNYVNWILIGARFPSVKTHLSRRQRLHPPLEMKQEKPQPLLTGWGLASVHWCRITCLIFWH